jgi:outer membrane biosynthesis protein TonB
MPSSPCAQMDQLQVAPTIMTVTMFALAWVAHRKKAALPISKADGKVMEELEATLKGMYKKATPAEKEIIDLDNLEFNTVNKVAVANAEKPAEQEPKAEVKKEPKAKPKAKPKAEVKKEPKPAKAAAKRKRPAEEADVERGEEKKMPKKAAAAQHAIKNPPPAAATETKPEEPDKRHTRSATATTDAEPERRSSRGVRKGK